jgi:GH15 family glucan-1,4-alpha-glucosidase
VFEKILTYANHLELYFEEIGPRGELLGKLPEAFTHLALIRAVIALDQQLGWARPAQAAYSTSSR